MTKHARSVATTGWAVAWLFLTGANATTAIPPTFEEIADRADLVFVGKAQRSHSEWRSVGTTPAIFTLIKFEMQEVLKWNAGSNRRSGDRVSDAPKAENRRTPVVQEPVHRILKPLRPTERETVRNSEGGAGKELFGYFNRCGEEYLFLSKGYVFQEV